MKRLALQIVILITAAFSLSCRPAEKGSKGDLAVSMNSEAVLLDVTATSCKSIGTESTGDLAALHMNLGKFNLKWNPPSSTAILNIAYIRIKLTSSGVGSSDSFITIGSEELNCIMNGNIVSPSVLTATDTDFTFQRELKLGGISASDSTLRTSFTGNGQVLVYGIITDNGKDTQYYGSTSFRFSFQGFF